MARIKIDCEGGPIVIEADDDGVTVYGIDIEAERAAAALGFDPSPCLVAWDNALVDNARDGYVSVVELLLAAGADVHADGDYALQFAANRGHAGVVELLLAFGADVHADDEYALRSSSFTGYANVVELLLAVGANVHAKSDYALYWAADNGHADVVRILEDWIEEHG